jgi:hypothetical protein
MKRIKILSLLTGLLWLAAGAFGAQVDDKTAAAAVKNWLRLEHKPLGASLNGKVKNVDTFKDRAGAPLYHVVNLEPSGFVIVSAEDQVEPIIAFAEKGTYDPSETNPLGALVARDLPQRVARARHNAKTAVGMKNLAKWQKLGTLSLGSTNSDVGITNNPKAIADVRIAPLLATTWGQGTAADGNACFNFFTPPYMAGTPGNSVCGCVATALGQLMHYNKYPTAGVGTAQFQVTYTDGNGTNLLNLRMRGGDGHGGPYNWDDMPLSAPPPVTINLNATASGGETEDDAPVNLGSAVSGTLTINYDMLSIPDDMRVFYGGTNGTLIYDTGLVSGTGTFVLPFGPTNGVATNLITIVMDQGGGQSGTAWSYTGTVVGASAVSSPTLLQAEAVGALTFDIGLAVHMDYSFTKSAADFANAETALLTTFQYSNAILAESPSINLGYDLPNMINPNLDARKPVLLAITNSAGGHCVVCDGYGYNFNVLYHHLNMGWGGVDDAWYQLPLISLTDTQPYYVLDGIIYNVFTNQTGEIFSGRVTDTDGNALPNAGVVASGGGANFQTTTDTKGIYAFPCVPSNIKYTVIVTNYAYLPATNYVSVGQSTTGAATCGNVWGANFSLTPVPVPPVFTIQPQNQSTTIGSPASFEASANGTAPISYQWQYQPVGSSIWLNVNNDGIHSGAQTSTLIINSTDLTMSGQRFQCVATNFVGSATSTPSAALTVTGLAPRFVIQPQSEIVVDGSNATFNATATGTGTSFYQWQYQPSGSLTWVNVNDDGTTSGSQTPTLTISPADLTMNGKPFQCVATNVWGSGTSAPVSLFISVNNSTPISLGTLAGRTLTSGSTDGLNTNALFNHPYGIAVDGHTNIFVADMYNDTIRMISASGTNWHVITIAGLATHSGSADGTNTSARFNAPYGIAVGGGNLFVADTYNQTIRELTPSGTNWVVTTIAGLAGTSGTNDGSTSNARFKFPMSIAVDNGGNLYVADEGNSSIRKLTFNGLFWTVSTIAGGSFGSNDGTNRNAQFGNAYGITVNAGGTVFVADKWFNTIRQLTPSGANWVVTTIAGEAGSPSGSADGINSVARFNQPTGIAAGVDGKLYVADYGNDTIRRLAPDGTNWTVLTVAGLAGSSGSVDGVGSNIRLNGPFGIAVDINTNVYVSDSINDTIRGPVLSVFDESIIIHLSKQSPDTFAVTWNAVAGHTYQLWFKTNMNQTAWNNLTTITASNWTGVISIPVGSDPQRFYRIVPAQ